MAQLTGGSTSGGSLILTQANLDSAAYQTDPPTSLVLSETSDYINIQFNRISLITNEDSYEIWRSQTSSTSGFSLIGVIIADEIHATMSMTDNGYNRNSITYYKIYAMRKGVRSSALEGSITPTNPVADVSNLAIRPLEDIYVITYNIPYDRRLSYVEIKMDTNAVQGSLSEGNSVSVYQGMSEEFVYKIQPGDTDKYHQFWVYTNTRA